MQVLILEQIVEEHHHKVKTNVEMLMTCAIVIVVVFQYKLSVKQQILAINGMME